MNPNKQETNYAWLNGGSTHAFIENFLNFEWDNFVKFFKWIEF